MSSTSTSDRVASSFPCEDSPIVPWDALLPLALENVGATLAAVNSADALRARLVCKHWNACLTRCLTRVSVYGNPVWHRDMPWPSLSPVCSTASPPKACPTFSCQGTCSREAGQDLDTPPRSATTSAPKQRPSESLPGSAADGQCVAVAGPFAPTISHATLCGYNFDVRWLRLIAEQLPSLTSLSLRAGSYHSVPAAFAGNQDSAALVSPAASTAAPQPPVPPHPPQQRQPAAVIPRQASTSGGPPQPAEPPSSHNDAPSTDLVAAFPNLNPAVNQDPIAAGPPVVGEPPGASAVIPPRDDGQPGGKAASDVEAVDAITGVPYRHVAAVDATATDPPHPNAAAAAVIRAGRNVAPWQLTLIEAETGTTADGRRATEPTSAAWPPPPWQLRRLQIRVTPDIPRDLLQYMLLRERQRTAPLQVSQAPDLPESPAAALSGDVTTGRTVGATAVVPTAPGSSPGVPGGAPAASGSAAVVPADSSARMLPLRELELLTPEGAAARRTFGSMWNLDLDPLLDPALSGVTRLVLHSLAQRKPLPPLRAAHDGGAPPLPLLPSERSGARLWSLQEGVHLVARLSHLKSLTLTEQLDLHGLVADCLVHLTGLEELNLPGALYCEASEELRQLSVLQRLKSLELNFGTEWWMDASELSVLGRLSSLRALRLAIDFGLDRLEDDDDDDDEGEWLGGFDGLDVEERVAEEDEGTDGSHAGADDSEIGTGFDRGEGARHDPRVSRAAEVKATDVRIDVPLQQLAGDQVRPGVVQASPVGPVAEGTEGPGAVAPAVPSVQQIGRELLQECRRRRQGQSLRQRRRHSGAGGESDDWRPALRHLTQLRSLDLRLRNGGGAHLAEALHAATWLHPHGTRNDVSGGKGCGGAGEGVTVELYDAPASALLDLEYWGTAAVSGGAGAAAAAASMAAGPAPSVGFCPPPLVSLELGRGRGVTLSYADVYCIALMTDLRALTLSFAAARPAAEAGPGTGPVAASASAASGGGRSSSGAGAGHRYGSSPLPALAHLRNLRSLHIRIKQPKPEAPAHGTAEEDDFMGSNEGISPGGGGASGSASNGNGQIATGGSLWQLEDDAPPLSGSCGAGGVAPTGAPVMPVNDDAVRSWMYGMPWLETLKLRGLGRLGEAGLSAIGAHRNLRCLVLRLKPHHPPPPPQVKSDGAATAMTRTIPAAATAFAMGNGCSLHSDVLHIGYGSYYTLRGRAGGAVAGGGDAGGGTVLGASVSDTPLGMSPPAPSFVAAMAAAGAAAATAADVASAATAAGSAPASVSGSQAALPASGSCSGAKGAGSGPRCGGDRAAERDQLLAAGVAASPDILAGTPYFIRPHHLPASLTNLDLTNAAFSAEWAQQAGPEQERVAPGRRPPRLVRLRLARVPPKLQQGGPTARRWRVGRAGGEDTDPAHAATPPLDPTRLTDWHLRHILACQPTLAHLALCDMGGGADDAGGAAKLHHRAIAELGQLSFLESLTLMVGERLRWRAQETLFGCLPTGLRSLRLYASQLYKEALEMGTRLTNLAELQVVGYAEPSYVPELNSAMALLRQRLPGCQSLAFYVDVAGAESQAEL